MNNNTESPLLKTLFMLLQAHRPAFKQDRPYQRSIGLLLGELFAFGRHTVTQGILALGLTKGDWSAWYRLFSQPRFDEAKLNSCLLGETMEHVPETEPFTVGVDGVQIPRSSQTMPGTGWMKAPRTPPFMAGIHRAQRFVNLSWLVPIREGYSRAVPLRWLPAFTSKARPALEAPCTEWEAALKTLGWLRQQLDRLGRKRQMVLVLADGSYDTIGFWRALPERTIALVRTARNRCLYALPAPYSGRGRRRKYGDRLPVPADWLSQRRGWQRATVQVRGRQVKMRFRLIGPCVRERVAERPLFLMVVRGDVYQVGKQQPRRKYRQPAFYLVSALWREETWSMPLPADDLLAWVWQRWELEVAHRELKSNWGIGNKQCWNPRATVVATQWSVWVYAVLLLSAYRTWGLFKGPSPPGRWWPGARRWSFNSLWRGYRSAFWNLPDFRTVWTPTGDNWLKKDAWLAGLSNAVAASVRI